MITNFLRPLQELADAGDRVHGSLNMNTETGRLSSRKPNLQNQPALEKDVYLIRDAFVAPPGMSLVVADYGQLELRLLAHMTRCRSMIDAFASGRDFHTQTAVGMFDHVREAVESGAVLLEKSDATGPDDKRPLVKDVYGAERRKAKTLNFSIAYGKTAFGLAADWGVSKTEAENMLNLWYADRRSNLCRRPSSRRPSKNASSFFVATTAEERATVRPARVAPLLPAPTLRRSRSREVRRPARGARVAARGAAHRAHVRHDDDADGPPAQARVGRRQAALDARARAAAVTSEELKRGNPF